MVSQGRHHHSFLRLVRVPSLSGLKRRAGSPQKKHSGPPSAAASIHPVVVAVAACIPSNRGVLFTFLAPSSAVGSGPVASTAWYESIRVVLRHGFGPVTSALRRAAAIGVSICDRQPASGAGADGEGAGRAVDDQAGVVWRKSTLSTTNGCVEVAVVGDRIAVRDSKQEGRGPVLEFTAVEWQAFVGGVRGGEFDLSPGR